MRRTILAAALLLIACSTRAPRGRVPDPRPTPDASGRSIRVVLGAANPRVGATQPFDWLSADGRTRLAAGRRNESWTLEREPRGARVRAVRPDGEATAWQRGLVARVGEGYLTVNGKRYRGEILVLPVDTTLTIVNRLGVEEYLRGVVPVEMGNRPREDSAALQAQAVASRSYAYVRLGDNAGRPFDVRASVLDQVYGGVDVENAHADAAVAATRGVVLKYQGRAVDAPYSSVCGGTTAEASEIWRVPGAPYLQRVSDRIGTSNRYYCENAPRYRWTRTLSAAQVNAGLEQYLKQYAAVPGGRPGTARAISIRSRTGSGRVGVLDIETDRGNFPVRANDVRYVLRAPGGEILSSTYFSVDSEHDRGGHIASVTLRGQGNGHGVGMCQWGAIGRARAGQSFRSILGTYYPGTTVGPIE